MSYNTTMAYPVAISLACLLTPIAGDMAPQRVGLHKSTAIHEFSKPVYYDRYTDRLNILAGLSYNWDGYGASAIDMSVHSNTKDFLSILDNIFFDYLNEEDIYCTPYGTIVLDFVKDREIVSVEVGERQIGFFTDFSVKENAKSEGEDFFNKKISTRLKESLIVLIA